ncbi:MAG: hypothetical protein ACLPXZ_29725 [Mycobacterium sp.]
MHDRLDEIVIHVGVAEVGLKGHQTGIHRPHIEPTEPAHPPRSERLYLVLNAVSRHQRRTHPVVEQEMKQAGPLDLLGEKCADLRPEARTDTTAPQRVQTAGLRPGSDVPDVLDDLIDQVCTDADLPEHVDAARCERYRVAGPKVDYGASRLIGMSADGAGASSPTPHQRRCLVRDGPPRTEDVGDERHDLTVPWRVVPSRRA